MARADGLRGTLHLRPKNWPSCAKSPLLLKIPLSGCQHIWTLPWPDWACREPQPTPLFRIPSTQTGPAAGAEDETAALSSLPLRGRGRKRQNLPVKSRFHRPNPARPGRRPASKNLPVKKSMHPLQRAQRKKLTAAAATAARQRATVVRRPLPKQNKPFPQFSHVRPAHFYPALSDAPLLCGITSFQ